MSDANYKSIEVSNANANIMRFAEQGIIPRSFESPWPSYEVTKSGKFTRKNEYLCQSAGRATAG